MGGLLHLSFTNYHLAPGPGPVPGRAAGAGAGASPVIRRTRTRTCTRTGRPRRNAPLISTLPASSLPTATGATGTGTGTGTSTSTSTTTAAAAAAGDEPVADPVMHIFLQDRQLNGDIVSRAFDLLYRRNQFTFDAHQVTTADQITNDIHDDEEDSGGYLRLVTTRDWISGGSDAPINKKYTVKDWQNESDKVKRLNLLKYEALKGELLFLTIAIGAACSMYCLIILSFEAAVSYSAGVCFSCLYLQLLYRHADKISKDDVPEIFQMKKIKRKVGITGDDVRDNFKKVLSGAALSISSPRLVIPALVYGLWALSQHFHNDILNFQLAPGVMGFFAYKAAALLQAYRDNEDLRMIFPENEESDTD